MKPRSKRILRLLLFALGGALAGYAYFFLFWLHQGLRHYGQSLAFHAVYGGAGPVYRLCQ